MLLDVKLDFKNDRGYLKKEILMPISNRMTRRNFTRKARIEKENKIAAAMSHLANMITQNCQIIGKCVAVVEILKDKGILNDKDINDKLKQLCDAREEAARDQLKKVRQEIIETNENKNQGVFEGDSLQSATSGTDEDNC